MADNIWTITISPLGYRFTGFVPVWFENSYPTLGNKGQAADMKNISLLDPNVLEPGPTPTDLTDGDEDGAVPWYQGIELYLAMRRLQKDCVFLQYRGEPHHLGKYANKLDYSIKMKEYFDYYLKGLPAPDWIIKGVPYRGK